MNVVQSLCVAVAALAFGLACTPKLAERFGLERAFAAIEHTATFVEAHVAAPEAPEPPQAPGFVFAAPEAVYNIEGGAEAAEPARYAVISDTGSVNWEHAGMQVHADAETQCAAQRMRSPL